MAKLSETISNAMGTSTTGLCRNAVMPENTVADTTPMMP